MKSTLFARTLLIFAIAALCASTAIAHDHTHIGINKDNTKGNADDAKLWIFATGSQHQWGTLEMTPTGDTWNSMPVFKAKLDCWHSAHPGHGGWQLGGADPLVMPDWRISLKRVSYSDPINFWQEEEATGLDVLTSDGATFSFGNPIWMADKFNENGTLGAWAIHKHIVFKAAALGAGQTFSATFRALDTGTTGYIESDPYTMNFVTVPEPTTLLLLAAGGLLGLKRRR